MAISIASTLSGNSKEPDLVKLLQVEVPAISPIGNSERNEILEDYRLRMQKSQGYRQRAEQEFERLEAFDSVLKQLSESEKTLIVRHGNSIEWFSVNDVRDGKCNIIAIRGNVDDHKHAKRWMDIRFGEEFGRGLAKLSHLKYLYCAGASKDGFSFAAIGRLEKLEEFEPPIDTIDKDLMKMSNLNKLRYLDLCQRKGITGKFLDSMDSKSRLRSINIIRTNFSSQAAIKLLSVEALEEVFVDEKLNAKQSVNPQEFKILVNEGVFDKAAKIQK